MSFSLDALQTIDAIDRRGSFAAAALELGRVPSALTYQIRKLEGDLDVLLFDRRGHKARLTAAGQELLREGRNLLQAAFELERRVQRVAKGWEVELRIAVDDILNFDALVKLLERFYATKPATRVRLSTEVLAGTWDALVAGRADLALGTATGSPLGAESHSGFLVRPLGAVEMVFAVSPDHPLARLPEPLPRDAIRAFRAVAVGDTSRNLPAATVGILRGQDVLTVASMRAKIAAQTAGLGCGYVALGSIQKHLEDGRLIAKSTTDPRIEGSMFYAWSSGARGNALQWFLDELENPKLRAQLLSGSTP